MKGLLRQVLRRLGRKEQPDVPFQVLFASFKKSLELNNRILDLIADANAKLSGDFIFDEHYIEETCARLASLVRELIVTINQLTDKKHAALFDSFHRIEEDIRILLSGCILVPTDDLVLPYSRVSRELSDAVGGKNAHIAEVGRELRMRIPAGFAITTAAFALFWEENGLQQVVEEQEGRIQAGETGLEEAAAAIRERILAAAVPAPLQEAIREAACALIRESGLENPCFAVRSSAIGEDEAASFAGQYRSRLGVPLDGLAPAWREVVAGLYTPEAMEYRRHQDFRPGEVMMAVACQLMVPADVSGVLYTVDPRMPELETMLINAAWGLGEPIVSGKAPTDRFTVERRPPHAITEMRVVRKDERLDTRGRGGTGTRAVQADHRTKPCLRARQVAELAAMGMELEKYFMRPQDVEFAVDANGGITVLQTRGLEVRSERLPRACDLTGLDGRYPILLRGRGTAAMGGVACGPVCKVGPDDPLDDFPVGAILVARQASPRLARVVPRAAGVITDVGAITGHLATVTREFRVPALFGAGEAFAMLEEGMEITLDTECLTIYQGIVPELRAYTLREEAIEEMYEYRLLRRVLRKIAPLNLVDPRGENFRPEGCRTYHDITRFIHEKAVETIIELGFYHAHRRDRVAGRLEWDFPLDLVLIDVGGGLEESSGGGIRPQQIRSLPMRSLLKGMSHPGIWDTTPAGVDFRGFMSSLTRTEVMAAGTGPREVGRNLAVLSAEYVNINFRLGYHFTVIDAYVAESMLDNHIFFKFSGGVTEPARRQRRARMLERVLSHYDFLCEVRGDVISARIKGMERPDMLERLYLLGLLVGFTRQLDVKMRNEQSIHEYYNTIIRIMEEER